MDSLSIDPLQVAQWTKDHRLLFWNMWGTWFAGAGSLVVALTSLWFARKADRLQALVQCGFEKGTVYDGVEVLQLFATITNLGDRPIHIAEVRWTCGSGRAKKTYPFADNGWTESAREGWPRQLDYGEQMTMKGLSRAAWLRGFREQFNCSKDTIGRNGIRLEVVTTLGKVLRTTPSHALLKALCEQNEA